MMTQFLDRYGPVALVTGASSGIGRALAEALWGELTPQGIDVLTLRPGTIESEAAAMARGMNR